MNAVERLAWLSALASEPKATLALMKVMTKLAGHVNAKTGQCNPLKKTLAKETGLHIDTVKNTLGLAVQLDYIERDTDRGRVASWYRLKMPTGAQRPLLNDSNGGRLTPVERANGGRLTPSTGVARPPQQGSPDPPSKQGFEQGSEQEYASAEKRRTRSTPTRCPADFQPDQKSTAWIESFGVTLEDADPAIHEFAAYWSERSTRRADWQATFRKSGKVEGFLLNLKQRGGKNGHRHAPDSQLLA